MYFVNPLILCSGDKSKDGNPRCLMKALLRLTSTIFIALARASGMLTKCVCMSVSAQVCLKS